MSFTSSQPAISTKKQFASILFATAVIGTGGLTFGVSAPVFAGDGECSWARDKGVSFDFHQECLNHDACVQRVREGVGNWDICDDQFRAEMDAHCINRWSHRDLRRGSCLRTARYYHFVVRNFPKKLRH